MAFGGPILGAVADQWGRRKPWIGVFTLMCVLAMGLMWFVTPTAESLVLALVLVGVGTITSEYAMNFYNSMLPALVGSARMGRWSGLGWGLGYAGGLICLAVALMVFVSADQPWLELDRESAQHVRATFVLAAVWYLVFAVPLFLFTPEVESRGKRMKQAVRDGMRQLVDSMRHIREYRNIVKFLIARMIYIDGLATVFAFGGVYAAGTFNMNDQEVLVSGIGLNVTAGIGAALFAMFAD